MFIIRLATHGALLDKKTPRTCSGFSCIRALSGGGPAIADRKTRYWGNVFHGRNQFLLNYFKG